MRDITTDPSAGCQSQPTEWMLLALKTLRVQEPRLAHRRQAALKSWVKVVETSSFFSDRRVPLVLIRIYVHLLFLKPPDVAREYVLQQCVAHRP